MKEGRKPGYPEKTYDDEIQILEPDNSNPNRDSNPHQTIGGGPGMQTC